MINLSSEPSLGTMILTQDGVFKTESKAPTGMSFPAGTYGTIVVKDRAGGEYEGSPFVGDVNTAGTAVEWTIEPDNHNHIPEGANYEKFVFVDGLPYKREYGRVARKQVEFPLHPGSVITPIRLFEDDLQRNQVGPQWISKFGRPGMHNPVRTDEIDFAMAARNSIDIFGIGLSLWQQTAVLWYAPLTTDSVEVTVGLCDGGNGNTTIVLCSNYAMTEFLGVRFHDSVLDGEDEIQIVTGKAWNSLTQQGAGFGHVGSSVPDDGHIYTLRYNHAEGKIDVIYEDLVILSWTDTSGVVKHGAGFRYLGAIFQGTFIDTGPLMYYWKAKDI